MEQLSRIAENIPSHRPAWLRVDRLLGEWLNSIGWAEEDLGGVRKGDANKVELAVRLRANTTMPLEWIARRLEMGGRGYLAFLLQQRLKSKYDNIID